MRIWFKKDLVIEDLLSLGKDTMGEHWALNGQK